MERPRYQGQGLRHGSRQLGVGGCLLGLLVVAVPTMSRAAESGTPQAPQERFLQHFISQSLGQGQPATAVPAPPAVPPAHPAAPGSQPTASAQPGDDLTGAALNMVLALGGILGLLVLGGYVIRRYLLDHTLLGKRTPLMRVLARVNITPKTGVALLEIPGKVLVLGMTGSTLVALGEVAADAPLPLAQPAEARSSFATTLEQATRNHTTHDHSARSAADTERQADVLLKISEAIQQKVSRLKQI